MEITKEANHSARNNRRSSSYRSSSTTSRKRRSGKQIASIRERIYETLAADHPMTIRQLFYRLVVGEVINKLESEYKQTVVRLTAEMRLSGEIPFGWIADNTRWMRKPRTHSSIEEAMRESIESFRRSVWDEQDTYVEIWLEKDALAGVLYDVTAAWDVPLMVTRGFPSLSFVYEAAEAIRDAGRPVYLYYFGDHDPSGICIDQTLERRLREFAPEADITFTRLAVLPGQIELMGLPTRPTKSSDSRSRNFDGESVEVDAIEPRTLRQIAEDCITHHIDVDSLRRLKISEAAQQEACREFLSSWSWGQSDDEHAYARYQAGGEE